MKKSISLILALCLLFCLAPNIVADKAAGTTYYVDSNGGDDSADGLTESTAWKTVGKASDATYSAGDRILFKAGGVFSGFFCARGSGTEESPIVVSSYGDTGKDGFPVLRAEGDNLIMAVNCVSYWDISDINFTAPEGKGLYITANRNNITRGITVTNCHFYDIYHKTCAYCDHFPISLTSDGEKSRLIDITIKDCSIENCAFGINMGGLTREWTPQYYVSPEESYNRNFLIEGCSLKNIYNDGIIIGSICGMVIRNCSLINTSTDTDHFTAPMWSHHADKYLIENCEIAGSTNYKDGMSVDFDGWTTNSTYQYVYSHDNYRFIRNCCYDNYTKNDNCTVRYCLSVNDNLGSNEMAQMLTSGSVDYADDEYAVVMTNFKFYNNTIINGSSFKLTGLKDAVIANNIFDGKISSSFISMRKSIGDDGKPVYHDFDGVITNNCFTGCPVPLGAKNSYVCIPGFVSDDITDRNSFMLTSDSKLLSKGIQVEDDMGRTDFYGNRLTGIHNIGCYDGPGEDAGNANILLSLFKTASSFISTLLASIYNFIDNCNNRYWLF